MKNLLLILILFAFSPSVFGAESATSFGDRVKVLLLTYNWPEEHDVLQSLLCLEPCTKDNNCPEKFLKYQVHSEIPEVYWNKEFIVIRPLKIGTPEEIVQKFLGFKPDLVSMSGHHSSGFSGSNGSFHLEDLDILASGEDLVTVFGTPSMVFLNGCNTEVKSDFLGDPQEYIQHILQDTEVRNNDLPRLRAAISQISGIQKSYQHIYPNACIMGYQGTSVPGGIPQIYGQFTNALRTVFKLVNNKPISPKIKLLSGNYAQKEKRVFRECPKNQWPCNLCNSHNTYYKTLNESLAKYLRNQKIRQAENRSYSQIEVEELEKQFADNRFYKNSKWACSEFSPDTLPVLPSEATIQKSGKLLLQILFKTIDGSFSPEQAPTISADLLHQLSLIRFGTDELQELKIFVNMESNKRNFVALKPGPENQRALRDYYNLAQKLDCSACLLGIDTEEGFKSAPVKERIAFAGSLEPKFGKQKFLRALKDENVDVAIKAASKMSIELGEEIYLFAMGISSYVGVVAIETLGWRNISDEIKIAGLNAPYERTRNEIWTRLSFSESNKVMLEALTSPNILEFNKIENRIHEKHNLDVFIAGLKLPGLKQRRKVSKKIRSTHSDQLFQFALKFNGVDLDIARNAAERLSSNQSIETFKLALAHDDYLVRSGAGRRLNEFNNINLYQIAIQDKNIKVLLAMAFGIHSKLKKEIIDLFLQHSKPQVRNAANIALERGE